jgi:signal transduction histidine kinase
MEERVRGLGGTLLSEARPGGGFALRVRLPRAAATAEAAMTETAGA